MRSAFALAALAVFAQLAHAAPLATVETLQPPAWLERGGQRTALIAGLTLEDGDRLITGAGARVQLGLHEHSIVKLGENVQLELPRLELKPDQDDDVGLFGATIKVVKGAFRFTTRELGKLRRREVEVSIGSTITAGIRGTDLWGKSDEDQALVCLLDGQIEVRGPEQNPQMLERPGSFYVVPRAGEAQPVSEAPAARIETWVPQTELRPEDATFTATGNYLVGLESSTDADAAQAAVQRFAELGYATEIVRARVGGKLWYRVVISGLATQAEAQRFAARARQALGLHSPWVMAPPNL